MRAYSAGSARVLIVGAGVIGLTTALCARRRGYDVIVLADRFAPHVTSNVAGALWEWPPAVCGQHRDQVSLARSKDWAARSYDVFRQMADDPATGVHLRTANFYFRTPVEHDPDEYRKMTELRERVEDFRHDERLIKENGVSTDAGVVDAYCHLAPMVDTDKYLEWLMDAVLDAGCVVRPGRVSGRLADQETQLREAYGATAIVNCSGLGSVELADDDMTPLRGAVVHAYRDHRVTEAHCLSFDEAVEGQNMVFIVPRGHDRLVLGGLVEAGEWSTDLTMASYPPIAAMLRRCQEFLPVLRDLRLVEGNPVRVGLRPYRQRNVRLECEPGTRIVHNTGHGGSGFTFSWGCAEEAVDLLTGLVA
ncbi:FAD-dependent oxidoreductase [Amycolatopsis pithecellobii]|uniref:FAD-dependent oxidoreductase n=1 Tax=Amycolatopsis pithecellobii TaxID=664692 RepID=A0A6N7Z3K8_9PSEU|nr:FAD-dependent oxidoreductase [Amycolatopsis pithecellobii]MTD54750.1 FAD-dependent oxidoreductase [Amycolatopsis pithecellobii]